MTTDMPDGALRQAYSALLRARRDDQKLVTVPLERIVDLVEGRGTEAERLTTLDAVMLDADSAREFEVLRALAVNRSASRHAWVRRPWTVASLAAAAVLLVIAVPAVRTALGPWGDEPTRDGAQAAVLLAPPTDASPAMSRKFEWHPVPGARLYVVEILTAAGTPVFTTRTADSSMTLPPDVGIEPLVEHRWWVATELADGTQRRSAFRRLVVREMR